MRFAIVLNEWFYMTLKRFILPLILLSISAINSAYAVTFKSVGDAPAILYDAPSEKGRRVFIAPAHMPIEVVLGYGAWTKVRDASNALFWMQTNALTDTRYVIVKTRIAKIYAETNVDGPVVFTANQNVVLEYVEPANTFGWIKVKHESGQTGYIKSTDIWGV